jgi:hypothetical protein
MGLDRSHYLAPRSMICDNCTFEFDAHAHRACPACGRDVIPEELEEAQRAMDKTYREQGLADSLTVIRPLMSAVVETVVTLAPMFPRSQLQAAMNEQAVFTLLCELEARGFRVIPIEPHGESLPRGSRGAAA